MKTILLPMAALAAVMWVSPMLAESPPMSGDLPPCEEPGVCTRMEGEPVEVTPAGDAVDSAEADIVALEDLSGVYAESDPVFDTVAVDPDAPVDYMESDPVLDLEASPEAMA